VPNSYFLAVALILIAQSAVLVVLLVQRTRRARAERALRESEERFRLIADRAPVMMWTTRPDTTLDFLNQTCAEFSGVSIEHLLGTGWLDTVHPDDRDHCARIYVPAIEARTPFRMEYRVRRADGDYRWVLSLGLPKDGPDGSYSGFVGSTIDITERKESEDALRQSQQRLTMATAAGALGVWDWSFQTNELFVDPGLKSLLGFEDAEISTRPDDWGSRVHPQDAPAAAARVQACIDGDTDVYEIEHRMLHKDGTVRWFLSRGSAVRGEDGRLHRMVGTKVDVTERKRAAEQFRLAIEAAPAGMMMIDRAGAIVLVNAEAERLFGYDRTELITTPVEMLVPGLLGDGRHELHGVRKDGTKVPLDVRLNPLDTAAGELVLVSVVDIAERQRAERENRDLMEQLHHLAGSLITARDAERARIARDLHDGVSQQLAALSIALSGFKRRLGTRPGDVDLEAGLSAIQQRAVALAESVRDISHDLHPNVLKHAGLTAALADHCESVSRAHALAVTCTADGDFESISPDTALCLYRIAQEALHNVIKHANARQVEVRLLRNSHMAELAIADDGKGFDVAETRRTRTGLGLVSIKERVRLAGGTLSVMTEWNKGTRIQVRLPSESADAGKVHGSLVTT
jgi:PAS domain S-box-containing protein